jgi:predicted 3-demethylubiquinone-9 3-methyltransferase (glyoxalase superfamily)
MKTKKITPFLWFSDQAEEAARFYTGIFPDSEIVQVNHWPEGTPGMAGKVITVAFRLGAQEFVALNGGPEFNFTEAVSFSIECDTQAELDYFWEKLTGGGEESNCGWLKDRYGLSWQVVPSGLGDWLNHPDPEKSRRVMDAMLRMRKIDMEVLKQALNA